MYKNIINKSQELKFYRISGITLISLVITIVVLIILAGVAMYLSLGNNGIFTRANEAKELTNKQTATEIINLKITNCQMNKYAEEQRMPTLKELSLIFGNDNEIEYVTEESKKQASTEYNVQSENPTSIYTKLYKYPYEFEINSSLQLASINGIKLASTSNNVQNTLSGNEHFTGKYYFNGKPIYEKTLYIEELPSATSKTYNHNISDIDTIWLANDSFILWNNANSSSSTIPSVHTEYVDAQILCNVNISNVTIQTGTVDRRDASAYITLRYTKTTDSSNGNTIPATSPN